ncbi:MAG: hypothetical protein FJ224_12895 [Lentisphaerae bacterium]|nr:hypothetical protein [Lentisphaerota bacterium]
MKSPFTFKRYVITASVISIVALVVGAPLLWRSGDPVWLAIPFAIILGVCLPLSVWFIGEIVWRGSRSSRLHDIPLRNTLIRLAAGLTLVLLSRHVPMVMWDFDEDMISSTLRLADIIHEAMPEARATF